MEFRALTPADLPKAKKLWKQAFQDSDEYIDFNFKRNIDLNNSLGCFDQKKLVSMLFMLEKKLACSATGKHTKVFFIVGVATDQAYQRRGIASQMMKEANKRLFNSGAPVVYLYPFDHNFYKKLGYHTISWMKKVTFKRKCAHHIDKETSFMRYDKTLLPNADVLLKLYEAFAKTKRAYFKRTKTDFVNMIETMAVDDGKFAVVYQDKKPMGYILYYLIQKKIHCVEAIFLNEAVANAAIKAIASEYSGFIYVDDSFNIKNADSQPYAMMQIVNLDKAKKVFGRSSIDEILGLEVMILEQY